MKSHPILISYRREDSVQITNQIFERLRDRFGEAQVFWDLHNIPLGIRFDTYLRCRFQEAAVVLAMIGDHWEGIDSNGRNRILETEDWVRNELSIALKAGVPVIPVLIGTRKMPNASEIPEEIVELTRWQSIRIQPGQDFESHVQRLIAGIECILSAKGCLDSHALAVGGTIALIANRYNQRHVVSAIANECELKALYAIDSDAYGAANLPYEVFYRWWSRHKTGLYALRVDDEILGAIGIWPICRQWLSSYMKGDLRESDLDENDFVTTYGPENCYWYVSGIVLKPSSRGSVLAGLLIRETLLQCTLDHEIGFPMNLFALAYSDMGERLLQKFGFNLTGNGTDLPDGLPIYQRQLSREEMKLVLSSVNQLNI